MSKAFSLVELLVITSILGMLVLVGMRFYNKQKQTGAITWAKVEMIALSRLMKMVKSTDGHYHQYIYAMGYRPKGKLLARVGTAGDPAVICCNKYPNPGGSLSSTMTGGWIYYNYKNDNLNKATDNVEICNDLNYTHKNSCKPGTGVNALATGDFSSCPPTPTTWCDCDQFILGAITLDSNKELSLNHQGAWCEES